MLLENIQSPADIRKLPLDQLPRLAQEARERIIEVVSSTGGHLASSLGAVEIIIALHYCLDTPRDKIIFDVGHQAYAHKIFTGRNKEFSTLRQFQGLSGFPSPKESVYDVFFSGHSSSAVSLAFGLVCARDAGLPQAAHFRVAALIGDGSLSGGLCFEGLNNAGHLKKDMLVVLNTNELSISPNVGAISTYINKLISLPIYNRFKDSLEEFARSRLPKGSRIIKMANKFEEGLKGLFIPGILFDELGFRYFGPFDGHSLSTLISALKNILTIKGPVLLHVVTKKGKGFTPAENAPVKFHGTGVFDVETGDCNAPPKKPGITFTEAFSRALVDLAGKDKSIVAITAAMPEGTGLDKFRDSYPERFFDVGIAEQHALCFAAGLAKGGFKPVVAVYSTFLQRAYDQIIEDIALQELGVVLAIDRAGLVGEDGMTHQGIFDIIFLKSVPGLVFMAPKDDVELAQALELAFKLGRPAALRYPRGYSPKHDPSAAAFELGKAEVLKTGKDIVIIALGSMVALAAEAADILGQEGINPTVINARFIKPLDAALFNKACLKAKHIFTIEEGIIDGGFGSNVADSIGRPVVKIGLPCEFIPHGKRDLLLARYGLNVQGIVERIKKEIKKNNG